jgi:hypothetical protein
VIPPPYLPVINFASFSLNGSELTNAVGRLKEFTREGSRLLLKIAKATSLIAAHEFKYSTGGTYESPDLQIERLHQLITDAAAKFDQEKFCLNDEFDESDILDFLMHPNSIANPLIAHFFFFFFFFFDKGKSSSGRNEKMRGNDYKSI